MQRSNAAPVGPSEFPDRASLGLVITQVSLQSAIVNMRVRTVLASSNIHGPVINSVVRSMTQQRRTKPILTISITDGSRPHTGNIIVYNTRASQQACLQVSIHEAESHISSGRQARRRSPGGRVCAVRGIRYDNRVIRISGYDVA